MLSMIGPGRPPILLLLLLLTGIATPAFALNFNAFWLYRETGGAEIDTRREFQQTYNLGAGPAVTYQLTPAISAAAFLGYSRTQRDLGQDRGWETVEQISPSVQLSLSNDIFTTQVAGFVTQSRSSEAAAVPMSRGWDATLASAWQIPFWPSLVFNYSERIDETEDAAGSPIFETRDTNRGVTVNWDLLLAQLDYRYNRSESEDMIGGSLSTSNSHFARVGTGGKLWGERIRFGLSQQAEFSTSDISVGPEEDGFLDEDVPGQTSAKVDPATDPNSVAPTDPLFVDPADPLPRTVGFNERVHIRFAAISPFAEPIDILRLTLADSLTVPPALNLRWALFSRTNAADPWEPVPGQFQVVPSTVVENSIEIRLDAPVEAAEILLVAPNDSGFLLTFTGLEALTRQTQDVSSRTAAYLTNFSANIRLARTLTASSNLTLEHVETESGDFASDFDRLSVSGRLGWTPTPYASPSLGYSETRETRTDEPDLLNRSTSLTVSSIPLSTLNLTLGATRTDRFQSDERVETSNNYSLLSTAQIYPDLSTSLLGSYRTTETRDSEGDFIASDAYGGRLGVNVRLNRALTSDLTTNYQRTLRADRESTSSDATLSLRYRPSAFLSLTGTGTRFLAGASGADSLSLSLDLGLLRTEKAQASFKYDFRQAEEMSNRFGLDWTWNISRALFLQTKANYTLAQSDTYRIEAFLSFRL